MISRGDHLTEAHVCLLSAAHHLWCAGKACTEDERLLRQVIENIASVVEHVGAILAAELRKS